MPLMVVKNPTHLNFCRLKEFSESVDFRFNSDLHVGHLGACHSSLEDYFWKIKSTICGKYKHNQMQFALH